MEEFIRFCVEYGYVGMIISAFIAGSVVPFSSEAVILSLMAMGLNVGGLLVCATIGNVLGGMTCYGVGMLGKTEWIARIFRIKPEKMEKAEKFVRGKGSWAAFWAFLPFIGSAVVIALGIMRANVYVTVLSMSLGKLLRYILVILSAEGILSLF